MDKLLTREGLDEIEKIIERPIRDWDARAAIRSLIATAREAMDDIVALQTRLEMNFAWDGDGNRIQVKPGSIPDGIECRDETIKLLDARAEAAEAECERLREALRSIIRYEQETEWQTLNGKLPLDIEHAADIARAALSDKEPSHDH